MIARIAKELKAVAQGDTAAADAVQGRRRAPRRAGGRHHRGGSGSRNAASRRGAGRQSPGQALILAEQKRRHGFLADADELTRRAAAAEPDNAEAAHMLGIVAHQSGKLAEAIEHVRRAIAIKPDVALYHANLGEMCRLAGRIDEAIAAGRRALELNPNYAGALSNLGIALFDQGKFEEALSFTTAPSRSRTISPRRTATAAMRCSGSSVSPKPRTSYRRAIELQPSFADAWNNLGTCLRELKRPEEAETVYRKALELHPEQSRHARQPGAGGQGPRPARRSRRTHAPRAGHRVRAATSSIVHYATVLLDQHKIDDAAAAASARSRSIRTTMTPSI